MTDQPTPKQAAINAATFLLHSYSMGDRDARPGVASAIVKAVTVALTTGEWSPDVRYDGIPVDHPLRIATTVPVSQAATLDLTADETAALRRMYNGEDGDTETALRWVATETGDEWRWGHHYTVVVTHADHPGLWGVDVKQSEGEERSYSIEDATVVTLRPVYAVPAMTYSFHAPLPPLNPTEVREFPGTGQPMTAIELPADGVMRDVDLTAFDSGTYDEAMLLPRGPVTVWRDGYPHRPRPTHPADGTPAELSGKQDGTAA